MRKLQTAVVAAAAACALLLVGGVGSAAAQDTLPVAKTVPVTGQTKSGKKFTGTYTIKKFVQSNGKAVAVGTLKGKLKNRSVRRTGVRMPVNIAEAATTKQLPTPGACPVLTLNLGPINLNLLGLRVATNQINLLIEAIPGAGNLLGNLLCAVTNLLNPSAQTPLSQLLQVLNALLALAPANTATAAARPAVATSG
jgi:hypothetical protein